MINEEAKVELNDLSNYYCSDVCESCCGDCEKCPLGG